jgi:hypothetical protein
VDGAALLVRRVETADAEPAVPGWRFAVDDLFRQAARGAEDGGD